MPYCPHCGNPVDQVPGPAPAIPETVPADVRIAEINADRDIKIAQLSARTERDWNETQAEIAETEAGADIAAAEALIEAVTETEPEPEPEPEGEPIVIEPEPEPEPDVPPPPIADPREPAGKKPSGWWDGYR